MAQRLTPAQKRTTRCEGTGTAGEAVRPAFVLNGQAIGVPYTVREGWAYCPACNREVRRNANGNLKAHKRRA